jgi:hypothetical protein
VSIPKLLGNLNHRLMRGGVFRRHTLFQQLDASALSSR